MLGKTALLVPAVLGALAVMSCSTDSGTEGSGTEASSARKVTVRGDDNLLEHVETKVSGGELEISQDEDIDPKAGITVDIRTPALNTVTVSGVGDLTARGIDGEALRS